MSIRLCFSAALLVCLPAAAWSEKPGDLLRETARLVKETTRALAAVKDAEGAKAVRSKLDRLDKQIKKVSRHEPWYTHRV
jgi:hypothetical protein